MWPQEYHVSAAAPTPRRGAAQGACATVLPSRAMGHETTYIALFLVATAVALIARWLRAPFTVALVVAGLSLGATRVLTAPHLSKELLFAVFLPGLVFEAAFHLDFQKFWSNKLAIHTLAIPGLGVAIGLTAVMLVPATEALHVAAGFGLPHALVFASLLAATDPIAVVGLFKSLGAPKRLAVLVEGESLLNDGTAVVVFTLVLAWVTRGSLSVSHALLDFVRVVAGGALVGALLGFAASKLTQRIEDPMIEITLTTIAAYGSFALAERVHVSGVIATVAAGMIYGNYGARTGMSPSTRLAVESFWEYVAFALNSLVFLLIGFEVPLSSLLHAWKPITVAFLAVTLGRAAVVLVTTLILRRTRERIPLRWAAVLTWGGLRGGLSMVLALGLPSTLAHRDLIITMTFGAVVLSILVQGLTMAPLLRRLGMVREREDRVRYESELATQLALKASLSALETYRDRGGVHPDVAEPLRADYAERLDASLARVRDLRLADTTLREEEERGLRRRLLLVERDSVSRAMREGVVGAESAEALLRDIDARILNATELSHE